MDNCWTPMREEFDRMLNGQNPTDHSFPPSWATVNGLQDYRYSHPNPPLNGSSPATAHGGAFHFMYKQQQLPPMMMTTASPVKSGLDYSDRFQTFSPEFIDNHRSNSFYPAGLAGFSHGSSCFSETLSRQNLETLFNRLNISSPNHPPNSSAVLDRNSIGSQNYQNPRKFSTSLKDIRGKICTMAKNQKGCRFLQTICEEGNPENIEMIFNEIKDHIFVLMTDASMSFLAQKLFQVCNERQITYVVYSVICNDNYLTSICLNAYGTKPMQKLIEVTTSAEQRYLIVSALRRITVTLTKNTNGYYVIEHCLKFFHSDEVQPILNVIADNFLDIATDKSGCCVLQHCMFHAHGLSKERLMNEIIENTFLLSEHPYGNYVVQHVLGMQIPYVTNGILQMLAGNFVYLAMNKFGSNVVEQCLKNAPYDQSKLIIQEMIYSHDFLSLILHQFGNYVAQCALQTAKGSLKETMINKVQKEYPLLHSHPHGKRVLALARNHKSRGLAYA